MIITSSAAFCFKLQVLAFKQDGQLNSLGIPNQVATVLSETSFSVSPSLANQTVPDWVANDPLFQLAVAAGKATVVTAPVNSTTLAITDYVATAALPLSGSPANAYITNLSSVPAGVALGTSTPINPSQSPASQFYVPIGGTVQIPIGSNTYVGAVLNLADGVAAGSIGIVCGA